MPYTVASSGELDPKKTFSYMETSHREAVCFIPCLGVFLGCANAHGFPANL